MLFKKKSPKSKSSKNAVSKYERLEGVELLFGLKGELGKPPKDYKESVSIRGKIGEIYALYAPKRSIGEGIAKRIAIYILDAISSGFKRLIVPLGDGYIFLEKRGEVSYSIIGALPASASKDEIDAYAESLFIGKSYLFTDTEYKMLKKLYLGTDVKLIVSIILVLSLFAVGGYIAYDMNSPKKLTHKKRKKPKIKRMTKDEKNKAKRMLSVNIVSKIKEDMNAIIDGGEFDNKNVKRISSFSVSKMSEYKPEAPRYNKAKNKWEFRHKERKRGGFSVKLNRTYQKVIPDTGYKLASTYEGKGVYELKKKEKIFLHGVDVPLSFPKPPFTIGCFEKIYTLGKARVMEREADRMTVSFKDAPSGSGIDTISTVLGQCPVYINTLSSTQGKLKGELVVLFNKKKKESGHGKNKKGK